MNLRLVGMSLAAATVGLAYPQAANVTSPKFEVASIKLNITARPGTRILPSGNRFNVENAPFTLLIRLAYNIKDFQISGGPSWTRSDRYDIAAEAEGKFTVDQMRLMIQSLMAERFKFAFHRETRQFSIYKLTVTNSGLKLVSSKEGSCIAFNANAPLPPLRPGETIPRICGGVRMLRGLIEAYGISMPLLSSNLSDLLGRVVIDDTGLKEIFDVHLEFAPDESIVDNIAGNQAGQTLPSVDSAPSIFSALQQLGLKLESAKGPVEVLVIDHVEKPTEN